MRGAADRVQSCTTTHFDGVIAVIDPETSWVARWQRICTWLRFASLEFIYLILANDPFLAKYVRGMYAVRVKGRIPEDVETELENRGIKYRPRDQTDMD